MIIATAGHVDHGKTSLIKTLTGQLTDRTEQELRRGMSIELGYAYLPGEAGQSIDFVDVPGHEKFMRTLLAGVGCVDGLMLVVAADDGVMPHTLEHLALINLLAIRRLVVVISKTALATAQRISDVEQEILQHTHKQGCPAPPVFHIDSASGAGIDGLRAHLQAWATSQVVPVADGPARMTIDRQFRQPGLGHVITGTILGGRIRTGDTLQLSDTGEEVRVRGIQVHHQATDLVRCGQRCALNLTGDLDGTAIGRGSQLLGRGTWAPTSRFDARVHLRQSVPRGLVQLHLGSAVVNARLVPLAGLQAGDDECYGQWILDRPLCCFQGDRFIIRDPAARTLLGSGVVVDPFAPQRGRQKPERLAVIRALDRANAAEALQDLLQALPDGVDLRRFLLSRRLDQPPLISEETLQTGQWLCRRADLAALAQRTTDTIDQYHQAHPDRQGPTRAQLARELGLKADSRLLAAALRVQLDEGLLQQSGPCVHLPGHIPRPDAQTLEWLERIRPEFAACDPRPPVIGTLVEQLQVDQHELLEWLNRLSALGLLVFVSRNRYLSPKAADRLYQSVRALAAARHDGGFTTAEFRDHTGIGRNHSVAVLEYFDRAGLTRQTGGTRMLR